MDRLAWLDTFVKVADKGGFAAAARHLNRSPASVTQQIQNLEDSLGACLLNRTTRSCSLTEAGRIFYDRCVEILDAVEEASTAATTFHSTELGTLRLNISPMLARYTSAVIGEYVVAHPQTSFELTITDRMGGLVESGFDLAIRADALPDSSLITRRLGSASWIPCATPAYLARRGEPRRPADLRAHNCLIYAPHWSRGEWRFAGDDGEHAVRVTGSLRSNDPEALRTAAVSGQGLALLPDISIADDLAAGRLMHLLHGYSVEPVIVRAVFPAARQISQKVRSFVDFAVGRFDASRAWHTEDCPAESKRLVPVSQICSAVYTSPA